MYYLRNILLMVVMLYISAVQAAPVTWKINKYKIIQQNPNEPRLSAVDEAELQKQRDSDLTGLIPGLRTAQMKELESYLVKVGEQYQQLGFKAPQLSHRTKKNDAYEIFYFDYNETLPTAYYKQEYSVSGIVNENIKHLGDYIAIDSSRASTAFSNYSLNEKLYEDLAHELFHAIQNSYSLVKTHSNLGDWIIEGTATAIGEDIARQLGKLNTVKRWGGDKNKSRRVLRWGARTYSNTLWVPELEGKVKNLFSIQEGHRTKGLWRYIGEYVASGGNTDTVGGIRPDYKYLARLFEQTNIYGKTNKEKELDWLDKFLKNSKKSNIGKGLEYIYPRFITSFTHYVPDRVTTNKKSSVDAWHKCLFVQGLDCRTEKGASSPKIGCKKVDLTEELTDVEIAISNVAKVSARCFEVNYLGSSNKLDIQIYMESNNKEITDSIKAIGYQTKPSDGSKKIINVLHSKLVQADGYPNMAFWEFEGVDFQKTNRSRKKSVIFVVTNVSKYASLTYEGKENESVKFNFSYAVNKGNIQLSN